MNNKRWIILFCVTLVLHITGIYIVSSSPVLAYLDEITKPLLLLILMSWFTEATKNISSSLKKWILLGFCFSWLGDVLLLFQEMDELFFLLGLAAFLLAHIFYIIFFHRIRYNERIAPRWWLLLIVVVYYAVLISVLSPYLGEMKLPVRVYGIVISFMFMLAMHLLFLKNKQAGLLMMTGALLFVISDSILAINKFYYSFEAAGVLIMLTYGTAQLLIAAGAINYISSAHKE